MSAATAPVEISGLAISGPAALALRRAGRVAVVQPLPGIGDMIWHLPHLRALAGAAGQPVTLIAKRRSQAGGLLEAEPSVARILWLPDSPRGAGGLWARLSGVRRLSAEIRAGGFGAAVLLHHSPTWAAVLALAGVPCRMGYGYGASRRFLNTKPFLPEAAWHRHPYEQASDWLTAAGIPMADAEPVLPVPHAAAEAVRARVAGRVAAIGIGSSEPYKQWGAARFAALIAPLQAQGWRCVLVGGPAEAGLAAEIAGLCPIPPDAAIGWPMGELAALLQQAAFYAGNDTGAANIAAAAGTSAYTLFGATEPLRHSARIIAVVPPGGMAKADGMARITPEQVLARIAADSASFPA